MVYGLTNNEWENEIGVVRIGDIKEFMEGKEMERLGSFKVNELGKKIEGIYINRNKEIVTVID